MAEELFAYGSNRITIDKKYCYFEINARKHKKRFTLDRDLRAVEALKDHIERWGYFWLDGRKEGAGKYGSLRLTVYKAYRAYGRDVDRTMPKDERYVYLCDGNPYNLTSSNLYVYGDEVTCNQHRRIWHDEHRIWIKLIDRDQIFFTEYDPILYSILCNTKLASWYILPENGSEYLFCKIDGTSVGLHTVVWLYHTNKLRINDLVQSIKDGIDELSKSELQIDHLRNNTRNNCVHNLTAMEGTKNGSKRNIVTQINLPVTIYLPRMCGSQLRAGTTRCLSC